MWRFNNCNYSMPNLTSLGTSEISFLRQKWTFFSHSILLERTLSLMCQGFWIRLWTVTSSLCNMSRLAGWFLLRKHTTLFYLCICQKKYSEKLEKYLGRGLFCGESCWISYTTYLKWNPKKVFFLEIWQRWCLQH